jgi:hypothetical protein
MTSLKLSKWCLKIRLKDRTLKVLINNGATHSFISNCAVCTPGIYHATNEQTAEVSHEACDRSCSGTGATENVVKWRRSLLSTPVKAQKLLTFRTGIDMKFWAWIGLEATQNIMDYGSPSPEPDKWCW